MPVSPCWIDLQMNQEPTGQVLSRRLQAGFQCSASFCEFPPLLLALFLDCRIHFLCNLSLTAAILRTPQSKVNCGQSAMCLGVFGGILDELLEQLRSRLIVALIRTQSRKLETRPDISRLQLQCLRQVLLRL